MLHYPEHLHFIASVTNLQITYCSEVYHKLEFLIADLLPFFFVGLDINHHMIPLI